MRKKYSFPHSNKCRKVHFTAPEQENGIFLSKHSKSEHPVYYSIIVVELRQMFSFVLKIYCDWCSPGNQVSMFLIRSCLSPYLCLAYLLISIRRGQSVSMYEQRVCRIQDQDSLYSFSQLTLGSRSVFIHFSRCATFINWFSLSEYATIQIQHLKPSFGLLDIDVLSQRSIQKIYENGHFL